MADVIASIVALLLGVSFSVAISQRVTPSERPSIYLGWAMHVMFGLLNVLLTYFYYGDGDMTSYVKHAQGASAVIRQDPAAWVLPYLHHALVPFSERLPFVPPGNHAPTQTVFMFVAFHQVAFGATIYGINLFVGAFSFLSKGALYLVFREVFPARYRQRIAIGLMAVPSVALWSGCLTKEGVIWMTAGWVVWGYYQAFHKKKRGIGLTVMVFAAIPVALVKAYILFPMLVGFGVWSYWSSQSHERRANRVSGLGPIVLILRTSIVFVVMVTGVLGLGRLFPRYALENFAGEAEHLQEIGSTAAGGSGYSLTVGSGIAGQVAAAPIAMFTAMFRPLLIEARSPIAAANALETTLLLFAVLFIVQRRRFRLVGLIRGSPPLMFCLVYVALFSVAVGLTTTNLGTLSRYRMPMVPYMGVMIAVLLPMKAKGGSPLRRRAAQKAQRQPEPQPSLQVVSLHEHRAKAGN
ncbi:MAG: putative MnhB-related membrane protein [Bradymonadia bacterium]|jgi:uncharacterized MnhB-related membrane protein